MMVRTISALAVAALAASSAGASSYSATVVSPTNARIIARDIVWNCAGTDCRGATEDSRPALLCRSLAKSAGKVESFAVNGVALPPSELDKCNAAASGGAGQALSGH